METFDKIKKLYAALERKRNYDFTYVDDGKKALEAIESTPFDAAILDQEMAPFNLLGQEEAKRYVGSEVAKRARELYPNMVIILNSNRSLSFRAVMKPINVWCYPDDDHEVIMEYLEKQLGE